MDTILAAGQYRRICQKVAFSCFPAEGYGEYELSLRVLRLPIGNGTYENIPHFLLHLESRFRLWYNSLRKKLTKTMIQERQGGSVCLQIPVSGGTAAVFLRILCLGRRCFAFDSWPRGEGKEKWSAVWYLCPSGAVCPARSDYASYGNGAAHPRPSYICAGICGISVFAVRSFPKTVCKMETAAYRSVCGCCRHLPDHFLEADGECE